ncbi:hypothetical protein [Amorphus sp. 3PC139-8]|uniref:hypothetical protein n=1 Tax=Amorphus sp. 3PC139-8 TaxID=2735676 RepID=UPI00345DD1B6
MRLLADVSSHGFGHMMQTSCVLAALHDRTDRLAVRLRSALPAAVVARFAPLPVELGPPPFDPALTMSAPDTIDVAATAQNYRDFAEAFETAVAEAENEIAAFHPDLVFSDIAAPGLVAARRAGVPAVALCSLNWADILRAVMPPGSVPTQALALLEDAYGGADIFLMPDPSMAMPNRGNQRRIGPIGRHGTPCPDRIRAILGLPEDRPLGLLSWGGWDNAVGAGFLAALPHDIAWISDAGPLLVQGIDHVDLIASCAIVVAKPGYGTFVDTIGNGVRLVFTDRPGWPETPALAAWALRHGAAREIHKKTADAEAAEAIAELMAETPPAPPALTGADEAAEIICDEILPHVR